MASWRLANSLTKLREQANIYAPKRSKSMDGTIGDAAHQSRTSDHNPWVKDAGRGVVTALDLTHDPKGGFDSHAFAEHLRVTRDPRIKYVISNRRIFSATASPWQWRKYSGSNPHIAHMHVSVASSKALYDDARSWTLPGKEAPATTAPEVDPSVDLPATRGVLRKGSTGDLVRIVQRLLVQRIDGAYGDLTVAAVMGFQRGRDIDPNGVVDVDTWAALDELEQLPTDKWIRDIVATVFGGKKDPNRSAYENRMITDSELGVALPFRFTGARPQVIVESATNGKQVVCSIVDVGPWNIDDPYWDNGARPQAETGKDKRGRVTNFAGIDLTPGADKAIGLHGKGKVHWSFVTSEDEGETA